MCENNSSLPQRIEDLSKHEKYVLLNHILVNDEYKVMYCYTPKVSFAAVSFPIVLWTGAPYIDFYIVVVFS